MELAGATVVPVDDGEATLRSAINAAMKDLINHSDNSYYLLGTACGPHPYPSMNVFFQKIIGEEVRKQVMHQAGKMPDILISCVGGGSNSL
jgi:tryptophan synthase beta chain